MRSQKQVRRAVKVRSLKNAAAGKWKTYRRRLEDRKAWQNNATLTGHQHSNALAPPPPTHRRIKEPKQRSPEELAERQQLREQRRLEKKLAKQRASTSTLPETKKEKKLKEVSSNDSPKKVSAEQKIAAETIKAKNSMIKETAKTKRLMNESESKHHCLKKERSVSAEEQKICQSSSPVEIEQKELMQSKKHTVDVNKTGKKLLEKRGRIEEINKKTKNDKMQPSNPAQIIKLQEPVVPTVLHSVIKEIQQDFLANPDVIDSAEVGTTHEFLKEKAGKKEREIVQPGQLTNEDEKSEIHVSKGKGEEINKEQKKKKRNRRSEADSLLSEHDFVEGDTCEMDYEEASADFTEIVGCRQKKKGGRRDEQQPKFMECNNKAQSENDKVTQSISVMKSKDQDMVSASGLDVDKKSRRDLSEIQKNNIVDCEVSKQQKQQSSENDSAVFMRNSIISCHCAKRKNEIHFNEDLSKTLEDGQEFDKNVIILANENLKRIESRTEEISGMQRQQTGQKDEDNTERKHFIGENLHENNIDQTESYREFDGSMSSKFIAEEATEHIEEFLTKEVNESVHTQESLSKGDEPVARDHDDQDKASESLSGFTNLINAKYAVENGCANILHVGESGLEKYVTEPMRFGVSEENLSDPYGKSAVEKISKGSDERKRIAFEPDLEGKIVERAYAGADMEGEKSGEKKIEEYLLPSPPQQSVIAASLINPKNLSYGMNDQIRKQEENIAEKKENKGLNEAVVDLTKNQNCTLENTGFKNEKIMDVTFSDDKISKDLEISKTEVSMKASIPEELEMKMAKLTEGHSEPLDTTNRSLIGNNVGNMSVTSFAKEAKYEANVEKMKPDVLVLQRDKVNHVPPARERIYKLLPRDIKFCVYMIEKHGEDYEAMAKDQGNIFRDSAKGIARRIRIFKESPQYEAYLKQKVEKNGSVA